MSQSHQKEVAKDVKKRFNEMSRSSGVTHEKFLSVYRFKTASEKDIPFEYQTSMHYYKRGLSPVKEAINQQAAHNT